MPTRPSSHIAAPASQIAPIARGVESSAETTSLYTLASPPIGTESSHRVYEYAVLKAARICCAPNAAAAMTGVKSTSDMTIASS